MLKTRKVIGIVLGLVFIVSLLGGCGSSAQKSDQQATTPAQTDTKADETKAEQKADKKPYIAVIAKGYQHQFWQAVKLDASRAAEKYGADFTFEAPETESQVDKQIEIIESALGKKPDALCLAALDSKAVIPALEKAKSMNIPVITFDSSAESDIPITFAATDSIAAGALAADKMAELLGGKGEVAVLANDQTSSTQVERRDGFVNRIKEKYHDIKIVDIQYTAADDLKATDLTHTLIQAHPNLAGIYSCSEGSANGAITAVRELKMVGKITLIGFDAGKKQKEAIKAGDAAGAITQDPVGMGFIAVEAAIKAIKGEPVEKRIDTGCHFYDKNNMDEEMFKPLLYD